MKISAGIIIRYKNKILFCHPTNSPNNFGPPKGGQEIGESLIDAALRETREEVGITISNTNITSEPIEISYINKNNILFKQVYLFVYDINKLSDIGLDTEIVPRDQLQLTEVDWAGFLTKEEVESKIFHRFKSLLNLI